MCTMKPNVKSTCRVRARGRVRVRVSRTPTSVKEHLYDRAQEDVDVELHLVRVRHLVNAFIQG